MLIVVANARRQADLFPDDQAMPEGFAYRAEVISAEEERSFAERFALLPFAPFEFHGFLGRRRVVSFGWRYDYAGRQIRSSAPLPEFLLSLRERAANVAGLAADSLQQALVTEYAPGAPIDLCRRRDPKGLYEKADQGKVLNLTGRDQPYEAPEDPDLVLRTVELTAEQAADRVVELVMGRGDCGTSPNSATR